MKVYVVHEVYPSNFSYDGTEAELAGIYKTPEAAVRAMTGFPSAKWDANTLLKRLKGRGHAKQVTRSGVTVAEVEEWEVKE